MSSKGAPLTNLLERALKLQARSFLERDDLATSVPQLEPLESYFLVKEVGVEDAMDIVRHTSDEQFRAFVDLDCWSNDELSLEDLEVWLAPFAPDKKSNALAEAFLRLDDEIQVIALATWFELHPLEPEEDPPPPKSEDTQRMTTVDRFFAIDLREDTERDWHPFELIEGLYRKNVDLAFRLLTAAKWELMGQLSEQAFQFRKGRLEDLGFLSIEDAVRIFGPPRTSQTIEPAVAASTTVRAPAVYTRTLRTESMLKHALEEISDPAELDRLESELVYLTNTAVMAMGRGPQNFDYVQRVAGWIRDVIDFGLNTLLDPLASPEQRAQDARTLCLKESLSELFRHGYRPASKLGAQAKEDVGETIRSLLAATDEGGALSRADRRFLEGLLGFPVRYCDFTLEEGEVERMFRSAVEIGEARQRLERLIKHALN